MNTTYTNKYREIEYDVLCLNRPNGWILELIVRVQDFPRRRFDDQLFPSEDKAREYGESEAQRIIDQLVASGSM